MSKSETRDTPVFIVAAPRSGTPLLQYMLRSYSRISVPTGESHFIVPLCANPEAFCDLSRPENVRHLLAEMCRRNPEFLDPDLHGIRFDIETLTTELSKGGQCSQQSMIARLFDMNTCSEGKRRWGDKTPYYVMHLPRIVEWFPGRQIIHVIRDGRDCALSLIKRKDDFSVYNVYHARKYWQHFVDVWQTHWRTLDPKRHIEIRHEDLVTAPNETMVQLCTFLEEGYVESVVAFGKPSAPGKTPLLQKPEQANNTGKWRIEMSARQITVFDSAAGDTLARLGYPLRTSPRKLPLVFRAAFRGHNRSLTAVARKFRIGTTHRQ